MRKLAAVFALALIAPSSASAFTVGEGATVVSLEARTAKALKKLGIEISPTGRAEAERRGIAFPVTGGKLVGLSGAVRHAGGLKLSDGRRSVTLSRPRIELQDRPFVQARVGDAKLKAFTLDVDDAEISDDATGSIITGVELDLSRQGAKALNAIFRTTAFETGTKLGDVVVLAGAKAVRFTGGRTDLALAKGAADAFASLGVSVAPAPDATAGPGGVLSFPITGGRLNGELERGTIAHSGGIVLTKGEASVTLTDFVVDIAESKLLARVNGGSGRVAILHLDLDDADGAATDTTLTIEDIKARLTDAAAGALNQAFATNAFQAGLLLGEATVAGDVTS